MAINYPTQKNTPNVTVEVGPVTTDDNDSLFDPAGLTGRVWTDYMINSRYEKDFRRYMLGVTAKPTQTNSPTVAFVQLANPTLLWVMDFTCSKLGGKPNIPSTDVGNLWVLLDENIEPGMITLGPDGVSPLYRISGTYYFGHLRPSEELLSNVNFTRPPNVLNRPDRTVPTSLFQNDLITINGQQNQGQ